MEYADLNISVLVMVFQETKLTVCKYIEKDFFLGICSWHCRDWQVENLKGGPTICRLREKLELGQV